MLDRWITNYGQSQGCSLVSAGATSTCLITSVAIAIVAMVRNKPRYLKHVIGARFIEDSSSQFGTLRCVTGFIAVITCLTGKSQLISFIL